ncbi:LysM peptidoglycan-binding domain-containing protein, partial [bacterium]|nr:LysM peptidoglycan-binding domain-containing protein [bacterium]
TMGATYPPSENGKVRTQQQNLPNGSVYIVQQGDTMPSIAKKLLGSSKRWREILTFNQISDPNLIRAGQRLQIPSGNHLETRPEPEYHQTQNGRTSPQVSSSKDPSQEYEVAEPEAETPQTQPREGKNYSDSGSVSADAEEADASYYGQSGGTYTIQRGDTMAKIAKNLLGSSKRWHEISRANPNLNPNKLVVGQSIVIPGSTTVPQFQSPMEVAQVPPLNSPSSFDATGYPPPLAMTPTYEPPPAAPPPMGYPGGGYAPPPAIGTPQQPPAVYPPPAFEPPPPPPLMSGSEVPMPAGPTVMPPAGQPLYHEVRYRLPDELKTTETTPYFANFQGYHGLFDTENALYPYIKTWHFGFHFRYDKYDFLNGNPSVVNGRQWIIPINLLYTGHRLMAGVTVPFQDWEVTTAAGGAPTVRLSGAHDPEVKAGYQIWKNQEGTHAVALHVAGRFPSGNNHQPLATLTGKTRVGVRIGPANATRGAWSEFGGAYSGVLGDRWNSHLNLGVANDAEDNITRYLYRGSLDYRVNHNFSLVSEVNGTTWEMDNGPDGAVVDLTLGMALFNRGWQAVLGFPISLQHHWGYGHNFGVTLGLNGRWD